MSRRRLPLTLGSAIERVAGICPRRHRELMRGMVAELEAVPGRAERWLFALGAVAAIGRLTVRGLFEPSNGTDLGGRTMTQPTTRQLVRRHLIPFLASFAALTLLLLAQHVFRLVPQMGERGASAGTVVEAVLLMVPFTLALTVPMAVFITVSWVFARLGSEGVLASARRERHGVRRLIMPVLAAAAVVAALALVSNAEIVPRANERLAELLAGAPRAPSDRTMTVGELQEAARLARSEAGVGAGARAAGYEVEIQKKLALAAACLVLAFLGAVLALRFPRGGAPLVFGASALVFTGYYLASVLGESLADRELLSPVVAMWMANAALLGVALLLLWRPGGGARAGEEETVPIQV